MNSYKQARPVPAVAAAVGAIGISTTLYVMKVGMGSSLPLATAPILAFLIYSGSLLLAGKMESPRQWLLGLVPMLGVHASLGVLTGIVFFFARPTAGQTESLMMATFGYGPSVLLEIAATVGICFWIPRLLSMAETEQPAQATASYDSKRMSPSIKATMHLRAGMMQRVSDVSKTVAQEVEPQIEEPEPEEEAIVEEALLTPAPTAEEPEFTLESAGRRFRVMNGKLVEAEEEPVQWAAPMGEEGDDRIPRIVREIAWEAPGTPGESEVKISSEAMLAQVPMSSIGTPRGQSETWLTFPQRWLVPQLAEGIVLVPAEKVLEQFPEGWLAKPVSEVAREIEDGYMELPLKEVIDQMPWSVFALPNQRPPSDLPGINCGPLFKAA